MNVMILEQGSLHNHTSWVLLRSRLQVPFVWMPSCKEKIKETNKKIREKKII